MPLDYSLRTSSEGLVDRTVITKHSASPAPSKSLIARLAFPLAYLAIAVAWAALLAGILKINNGTFVYTLDDPYIHLALSDQIRHGNYGLYPGTHAAPSSSILFPFILAAASGTAIHPYFPLILNTLCLFLTVEILRRFLIYLRLGTDDFAVVVQAGALFMVALCFNLVGVVFTGLEHSLHIATVAAIVYGLAIFLDQDDLPWWLPAVLVLSPLVRYESLALAIGVLIVLAMKGRIRIALATFAAIALLVGVFSAFLVSLGLPPLPSSILSKSAIASGSIDRAPGSFLAGFVQSVDTALGHPIGLLLLLVGVAAALRCALEMSHRSVAKGSRRWTANGFMCLAMLCLLTGQTVAGRWGWFERYEVYAIVATAMMGVYLGRSAISYTLASRRHDRHLFVGAAAAALFIFGARYLFSTSRVPTGSNNIYEQQLQMHYFVDRFYRGPVAVNDLGLASYRNPYFVLDLGGLGSEAARRLFTAKSAAGYQSLVAASGIHLIIVYDEWFTGNIPPAWQKVGTMYLSRFPYAAAHPDVQFYVTDDATAVKVHDELVEFQKILPRRVQLTIY